jgi:hypothetical protein
MSPLVLLNGVDEAAPERRNAPPEAGNKKGQTAFFLVGVSVARLLLLSDYVNNGASSDKTQSRAKGCSLCPGLPPFPVAGFNDYT